MPVPGTQEIRKPLLEAFKGEAPHSFAINAFMGVIAADLGEDITEMSSYEKNILRQRINQARDFLIKNGLISNPSHNAYMITKKGSKILENNPDVIDEACLTDKTDVLALNENMTPPEPPEVPQQNTEEPEEIENIEANEEIPEEPEENNDDQEEIQEVEEMQNIEPEMQEVEEIDPNAEVEEYSEPEYQEEAEPEHDEPEEPEEISSNDSESAVPSQTIEAVITDYNSKLADDVLAKIAALPSDRFEMLVIDLLSKMGYHAYQNARYTNETSGSEFIQGVILDDKAGMPPIYIHAQKSAPGKTAGRADMNDFIEAISDKGGKGIFATTANFSEQAVIAANDERIMLIDGKKLAGLMIAHNFCVNVEKIFEIKAIDLETLSEYEE